MRKRGFWTRAGLRVFAKEFYDAKLLSEEGWNKLSDISNKSRL